MIAEMDESWFVVRAQVGFDSRVGLMAGELAAERAMKMDVVEIHCIAAQVVECLAYRLFLIRIVSACVEMGVSEATRGAGLVVVPWVRWMVGYMDFG